MLPEAKLLLLCSRTTLNAQIFGSIRKVIESGVDWDLLLQHALYHKSFPLLYNSLKKVCPDMVPEAVLQQLKDHYMKNAVHSLFLDGIRYGVRMLTNATKRDWEVFPLPAGLVFLHYFLRPVRLVWEFGVALVGRVR